MNWTGVLPAITTNLRANGAVDHAALARHCRWMIDSGCKGIVCGGSLGEAATLSFEEKIAVATLTGMTTEQFMQFVRGAG